MMKKIYADSFGSFDNYWVEGGEAAWVDNHRLYQKADPADPGERAVNGGVSTIWCRTPFPANVEIRVKACVVASSVGTNNMNLFLSYGDPDGLGLWETRNQRANGDYAHYHNLDGYIFTFIRDWNFTGERRHADGEPPARYRLRRCPGFNLLTEKFADRCEAGKVYRLVVRKNEGQLSLAVDGETILEAIDPSPLAGGHFGFRTFRTELWWSDLEVWAL